MTSTNTTECNQVLWVVGALERLATLGMLHTPPLAVSSSAIDLFIDLDDVRHILFPNNQVVEKIVGALVYEFAPNIDVNTIEGLTLLVVDYKDNRDRIMKYALDKVYNEN
jgi:hypothetical protein